MKIVHQKIMKTNCDWIYKLTYVVVTKTEIQIKT